MVYYLIAKNATSSIRAFLKDHCQAIERNSDQVEADQRFTNFTKWTTLRDPLDRFYSAWNERIVRGKSPFRKICAMGDDNPRKWRAFSRALQKLERSDVHFLSQHKYLRRPDLSLVTLNQCFLVDDTLDDRLTVFFQDLGVQPAFSNHFRSGGMRSELERRLEPRRVKAIVREVYRCDYELIDSLNIR